jgi:hypothetical protein
VRFELAIPALACALFALQGPASADLVKTETKIPNTAATFSGGSGERFGQGSASIGDLDGDGINEIAVGAPFDGAGAVWILFLDSAGQVRTQQKISDGTGGLAAGVLSGSSHFGYGIASIGDLNQDGVPDMAVGLHPSNDVMILFLTTLGTVSSHQMIGASGGGFTMPLGGNDNFGSSLAGLGDFDGDGVEDLVVGAQGTDGKGAVYVLFMNTTGTVKSSLKVGDAAGGLPAGSISSGDHFGYSVCSLGDLDGDGITDIAVGAALDNDGGTNCGAVWILCLDATGAVKAFQKISALSGNFLGTLDTQDHFGAAVAPLSDFDGGGPSVMALAVGAVEDDDGGPDRGAFWILLLESTGMVNRELKISQTAGGFGGTFSDADFSAFSLSNAGDIDGDGYEDLVVGNHCDDTGATDAGAVWVMFLNGEEATATHRNASPNLNILTVTPPVLGEILTATMQPSGTGHLIAGVVGYSGFPTFSHTMPAGQVVLVDFTGGPERLHWGVQPIGPTALTWNKLLPADIGLCGMSATLQGFVAGTVFPFELTNAVDLLLGGF